MSVLQALFDAGGSVIDSSPMYGRSEAVAGELLAAAGSRNEAFVATKVWTRGRAEGIAQMNESLRLLRTERIERISLCSGRNSSREKVSWFRETGTVASRRAAN